MSPKPVCLVMWEMLYNGETASEAVRTWRLGRWLQRNQILQMSLCKIFFYPITGDGDIIYIINNDHRVYLSPS